MDPSERRGRGRPRHTGRPDYSSDSDDLSSNNPLVEERVPGKDIALPDEVEQRSKAWMLFINFSKFSATSKEKKEWSPLLEMMWSRGMRTLPTCLRWQPTCI